MKNATPRIFLLKHTFFFFGFFLLNISLAFAQHTVTTHAGSTQGFADATGTAAKFKAPTGICISPDGAYLYVADYSGHRIRKINVSTRAVSTVAGSGASGYSDAAGTAAMFSYPSGICISGDGNKLYVSDYGNSCIRQIIISSQVVTTIAGNGAFSYADNSNGLLASFNSPTDIVNNHDSVLYISDTENHLIRKYDVSNSAVTTIAGMQGVAGFQNGIGTNAAFRFPKGMSVSEDGNILYVADNGNNLIRGISISNYNVITVAGDGSAAFADNADASLAKFNAPNGVSIVPGNPYLLYVADNNNNRIREINLLTSSVSTIAGTGAVPPASVYGDNSIGLNAKFFYPTNLVVSPDAKDIYVADQGNFRIRRIKTDLSATAVAEASFTGLNFYVFPNPGSDVITITGKSLSIGKLRIELIDSSGNIIHSHEYLSKGSQESFNEDISLLPSGIYMLKINSEKGFITRKLIVSR
jgi:sugar lactone lactonase YvrE